MSIHELADIAVVWIVVYAGLLGLSVTAVRLAGWKKRGKV